LFDDITRHAGIGVTDSVENHIEWDLCAIRIAAFARFNQSFGFVQDCSVDKDYVFCCSGAGSKKSRGIALLSPTVSFASVFNLRFLDRLPLHIWRIISPTVLQGNDVINNIARPPFRITCPPHKVSARTDALRLILPSLLSLATVDFFGIDDFRDRVEVVLGFDDVLRDRVVEDREEWDDDRPFCAITDTGSKRATAASAIPSAWP
jgi:hypothetical protein